MAIASTDSIRDVIAAEPASEHEARLKHNGSGASTEDTNQKVEHWLSRDDSAGALRRVGDESKPNSLHSDVAPEDSLEYTDRGLGRGLHTLQPVGAQLVLDSARRDELEVAPAVHAHRAVAVEHAAARRRVGVHGARPCPSRSAVGGIPSRRWPARTPSAAHRGLPHAAPAARST